MDSASLNKFTRDATPQELLELMIILHQISLRQDVFQLNRFLTMSAKIIGPEDFNRLLRRVIRMMGHSKCGQDLCSDWLMTNLYQLYSVIGT